MRLRSKPDDARFDDLLDEMIYSGDAEGYIRKKSKDIISDEFLDFLREKYESLTEEDEKEVVKAVIDVVDDKLTLTDGIVDSAIVFEKRFVDGGAYHRK